MPVSLKPLAYDHAKINPGKEMLHLFSPQVRSTTWRKLWLWLAEVRFDMPCHCACTAGCNSKPLTIVLRQGEKELGLDISDEAIAQMKAHLTLTDEDFKVAATEEKIRRHDGQQLQLLATTGQRVDVVG